MLRYADLGLWFFASQLVRRVGPPVGAGLVMLRVAVFQSAVAIAHSTALH